MNRESAVFLGAGRAALLQLAHPWVAVALAHHSTLLNDAVGRFHSTFRVIYTMLFGTRAQAVEASERLYQLHTSIRGELPHAIGSHVQGEHYEANEVAALRWVYATLVESAILAYDFVLPSLSSDEREQYYLESKRMAALFGIQPADLPHDWAAFTRYTAEMFASPQLGVDANALALGHSVLSGVGTWLHPPHWYLSLTAFWMPPRLRAGFALPFGDRSNEPWTALPAGYHDYIRSSRKFYVLWGLFMKHRPACAVALPARSRGEATVLDGRAAIALFSFS